MGFAASQARFLSLTSRLSDVEYEAQQISQERLSLSNQMDVITDAYADAMQNQIYMANVFQDNGMTNTKVALSYEVITGDQLNGGLGMMLISESGQIVVASREEMAQQIENSLDTDSPLSEANFLVFEDVTKPGVLQKNIEDGNFYLSAGKDKTTNEWTKYSPEALSTISREYDTSDDAAAKAEYDRQMAKIERDDTALELRLEQLETEHKALEVEIEALDKVIENDLENGFKTFG